MNSPSLARLRHAASSGHPTADSTQERATALGVATLILLAAAPYVNTLWNGFVYDDNSQVLGNPYIRSFRFLPRIFSTTVWSFVGTQGVTNYYRPMMTLGYLICYRLSGPLAYEFHLANLCFHAAATLLVFAVALKVLRSNLFAWVAGAIFAVLPIHTEAVAWIAAVTDLEVTLFYLLTFWLFLQLPAPGGRRRHWVKLAMVSSFALTIFSKEQSLTFPLVAVIYEHFYREDRAVTTWMQKIGRYGDLFLMDFAYVLFRIRYFGAFAPERHGLQLTIYEIGLSAVALIGKYAGKLVWPVHLCAYYMFRKSDSPADPRVLLGLLTLVGCAALFLSLWKVERNASFGMIWMAATLAPVLNAHFMAGNVFAERYLYLPSAGFAWVLGWGLGSLWKIAEAHSNVLFRAALGAAGAVLVLLCSLRIFTRNRIWYSNPALYADTLRTSPDAASIHINLGVEYWNRGDAGQAEKEWRTALHLDHRSGIGFIDLGLAYEKEEEYSRAETHFRLAMLRRPDYTDSHLDLGELYEATGRLEAADLQLRAAALLSPLNPSVQSALGRLYLEEGALDAAERQFRASVRDAPNRQAYDGLGDVMNEKGDWRGAQQAFRQAIELDDIDSHAHFGMARIARVRGQDAMALREYQLGLETDPLNADALRAIQQLKSRLGAGHEIKP